jgi:WD40 repeat protein
VTGLAFGPEGTTLAAGCSGATRSWELPMRRVVIDRTAHDGAGCVAFSPDGRTLATGSAAGVQVREAATGKALGPFLRHPGVRAVVWHPGGRLLVTAGQDGRALLWDVATGWPVGPPLTQPSPVEGAALSPDGRLLFTGSPDWVARFWELPRPVEGDAAAVRQRVEALTGMRLDETGRARALTPERH